MCVAQPPDLARLTVTSCHALDAPDGEIISPSLPVKPADRSREHAPPGHAPRLRPLKSCGRLDVAARLDRDARRRRDAVERELGVVRGGEPLAGALRHEPAREHLDRRIDREARARRDRRRILRDVRDVITSRPVPSNGGTPASISYTITPSANRSQR